MKLVFFLLLSFQIVKVDASVSWMFPSGNQEMTRQKAKSEWDQHRDKKFSNVVFFLSFSFS